MNTGWGGGKQWEPKQFPTPCWLLQWCGCGKLPGSSEITLLSLTDPPDCLPFSQDKGEQRELWTARKTTPLFLILAFPKVPHLPLCYTTSRFLGNIIRKCDGIEGAKAFPNFISIRVIDPNKLAHYNYHGLITVVLYFPILPNWKLQTSRCESFSR